MKLLLLAFLMTTLSSLADGELRHLVFFKFSDTATPEKIERVEKAFAELPEKIDTIVAFEWGINISKEQKDKGFTHAFQLTFKDQAGLDAYLPHPAHKAFGAKLAGLIDDVFVFDYIAK
ncbi:Dabb family protein [Haloferula sargassicola]|uniref:Stress-response A/B barrel domain-containing protein n=1 Tax=Haloferula sargassicola TaxID=490096 RepID=A0ABP9UMW6_9BACT